MWKTPDTLRPLVGKRNTHDLPRQHFCVFSADKLIPLLEIMISFFDNNYYVIKYQDLFKTDYQYESECRYRPYSERGLCHTKQNTCTIHGI